jgi:hypothetical protein
VYNSVAIFLGPIFGPPLFFLGFLIGDEARKKTARSAAPAGKPASLAR